MSFWFIPLSLRNIYFAGEETMLCFEDDVLQLLIVFCPKCSEENCVQPKYNCAFCDGWEMGAAGQLSSPQTIGTHGPSKDVMMANGVLQGSKREQLTLSL